MNSNNSKKHSSKQKALNSSIFIIILIILIVYLAVIPTIKKIKKISTEIINEKINIVNKVSREKNIKKLTVELKEIEPKIADFKKIFINEKNQIEFIESLEKLANKHNIEQTITIKPPDNIPLNKLTTVSITIDSKGELSNMNNYLKALESLDYQININDINFDTKTISSVDGNSTNINTIASMKILADTFWKRYEDKNKIN
ncbi:type 4a pilus biogenesis protein PilO [Candidatus Parcubacteria bacterium]|nr:type 4a pilus biogenesis protein PilO [Candidatus Parcubacteria bacterium]